MERRIHERHHTDLAGTVTDIAAPDRAAAGRIIDISQSGICAEVPLDFCVGTIVKLHVADCSLFGHVIHSRRESDAHRIGIEVVRALIGDSDLALLLNAILAETMPSTPGVKSASNSQGRTGAR